MVHNGYEAELLQRKLPLRLPTVATSASQRATSVQKFQHYVKGLMSDASYSGAAMVFFHFLCVDTSNLPSLKKH